MFHATFSFSPWDLYTLNIPFPWSSHRMMMVYLNLPLQICFPSDLPSYRPHDKLSLVFYSKTAILLRSTQEISYGFPTMLSIANTNPAFALSFAHLTPWSHIGFPIGIFSPILFLCYPPRVYAFLCNFFDPIKGFSRVSPCYACALPKGFFVVSWFPPLVSSMLSPHPVPVI